jgi:hypothetical protein
MLADCPTLRTRTPHQAVRPASPAFLGDGRLCHRRERVAEVYYGPMLRLEN